MGAGKYNFIIEQGADLNRVLNPKASDGSPIDLTDYSARMKMRETVDNATVIDDLTTANGRITLQDYTQDSQTFWRLILHFPNATTSAYTFKTCVYDLEIIDGSDIVTRMLEGVITLSKEVTR